MSGNRKFFLDTNLFIYSYDDRDPIKRSMARELIHTVTLDRTGVISYQVVQEFFNVALKRFSPPMKVIEAEQYLRMVLQPLLGVHSTLALYVEALHLHAQSGLSWYDSLIVSAALQTRCDLLFTEDLQHGQRFGSLQVRNPFL